jgi:hypothetical protein
MPDTRDKPNRVDQRAGRVLASIPRGRKDPRGDHWEEFRVSLEYYNGSPYVSLRLFERGGDGRFYPVKNKGCSVRLSEGRQVADAILDALELADSPGGGR